MQKPSKEVTGYIQWGQIEIEFKNSYLDFPRFDNGFILRYFNFKNSSEE